MLAPVRASLAENKPIRWRRVNELPGYVYFDHSIHIANGVGCSTCHGPIHEMKLTRRAEPLTMQWCLACHRDPAKRIRPREAVFDPAGVLRTIKRIPGANSWPRITFAPTT